MSRNQPTLQQMQQIQYVPKRPHTTLSQRTIMSVGGAEKVFNEGNKSNMVSILYNMSLLK